VAAHIIFPYNATHLSASDDRDDISLAELAHIGTMALKIAVNGVTAVEKFVAINKYMNIFDDISDESTIGIVK